MTSFCRAHGTSRPRRTSEACDVCKWPGGMDSPPPSTSEWQAQSTVTGRGPYSLCFAWEFITENQLTKPALTESRPAYTLWLTAQSGTGWCWWRWLELSSLQIYCRLHLVWSKERQRNQLISSYGWQFHPHDKGVGNGPAWYPIS